MDVILDAHSEATIERIKQQRVVLAPQDTTTLNYSTHPMTQGLGPTNTADDKSIGLLLHDTLAFTEDGTPLGVLDGPVLGSRSRGQGQTVSAKDLADRAKGEPEMAA